LRVSSLVSMTHSHVVSRWQQQRCATHIGRYKGAATREGERIPKKPVPVRLKAETRLHEAELLVNAGSAMPGEYVPGPCTHRPSPPRKVGNTRSRWLTVREGAVEGRVDDWGEVVTGSRSGSCGWITSFLGIPELCTPGLPSSSMAGQCFFQRQVIVV